MRISFLGQQNGQGKTTLAVNVAMALAYKGDKVLLIDADPQASALQWSNTRLSGNPVHKRVELSVIALSQKKNIHDLASGYNYTVIDGTPQDQDLIRAVVTASDIIIIPLRPGSHDLISSPTLNDIIREENEEEIFPQRVFHVLNKVKDDESASEFVKHNIGPDNYPLLNTHIADHKNYAQTFSNGLTVIEQGADTTAAREIYKLADEILGELNKERPSIPIDEL